MLNTIDSSDVRNKSICFYHSFSHKYTQHHQMVVIIFFISIGFFFHHCSVYVWENNLITIIVDYNSIRFNLWTFYAWKNAVAIRLTFRLDFPSFVFRMTNNIDLVVFHYDLTFQLVDEIQLFDSSNSKCVFPVMFESMFLANIPKSIVSRISSHFRSTKNNFIQEFHKNAFKWLYTYQ